jgi:hypothetical protein
MNSSDSSLFLPEHFAFNQHVDVRRCRRCCASAQRCFVVNMCSPFALLSLFHSQLATVFQRKAASSEAAPAEWQQEAKAKVVS